MRIGELAALAGVTTRTVRHYHHIGLLPEPPRQSNGYRAYGLRDAVELSRVRRLTELGLSLDEVRDALADDAGRDLHDILAELDADLARQEDAIRERRARLAELLAHTEHGTGLPPEGPVSPELAAIFADMARTSAGLPGPEPAMAAKERELLALLDTTADTGHRDWLRSMMRALSSDADAMSRAYEIYARLDELADAATDDPRIPELARTVADSMPPELTSNGRHPAGGDDNGHRSDHGHDGSGDPSHGSGAGNRGDGAFAEAFFADFPPAQAEVLRQAMRLVQEREDR